MTTTFLHRLGRASRLSAVGFCLIALSVTGAEPVPPRVDSQPAAAQTPQPESVRLRREQVREAQAALDELAEQLAVARTKLSGESVERKTEIGRLKAIGAAVDDELRRRAAEIQRLEERRQELQTELAGLDSLHPAGTAASKEVADRYDQTLQQTQARLDRLSRAKTELAGRLARLRAEYMRGILAAVIAPVAPTASPLEMLLDSEIGTAAEPSAASAAGAGPSKAAPATAK